MAEILDFYRENYAVYSAFIQEMQERINHLLLQKKVRVQSIGSRLKTEESLQGKVNKGRGKYKEIGDITDICGIRIITYFDDDIDRIGKILTEEFSIDPIHSIDKRKALAANQFGYLSLHLIAGLPFRAKREEQYRQFRNCKVEIQIRSVLQHAWAEIEHDLAYKAVTPVSPELRRRFSRVAGLLELADAEFCRLRHDLEGAIPARAEQTNVIAFTGREKSRKAFFPLKKASGYLGMGLLLAGMAFHEMAETQWWHPLVSLLHTDTRLLLSLMSGHMTV